MQNPGLLDDSIGSSSVLVGGTRSASASCPCDIDDVVYETETVKEGKEAQRAARRGSYSCFFWPKSHVEAAHEIHQTGQEVFRCSICSKILDIWRLEHLVVCTCLQFVRSVFSHVKIRWRTLPYDVVMWRVELMKLQWLTACACIDAEYHSPLFLDCCGLLRRVLRDLRHDFGFRVGPWNQSYLFDTLPVTVEREEDMKPGDLVFVSATYHNAKSMIFNATVWSVSILTNVRLWFSQSYFMTYTYSVWEKGTSHILKITVDSNAWI